MLCAWTEMAPNSQTVTGQIKGGHFFTSWECWLWILDSSWHHYISIQHHLAMFSGTTVIVCLFFCCFFIFCLCLIFGSGALKDLWQCSRTLCTGAKLCQAVPSCAKLCQAVPSCAKLCKAVQCMAAQLAAKVRGDSGEQHLRSGDANLRLQAGHGWVWGDVVDVVDTAQPWFCCPTVQPSCSLAGVGGWLCRKFANSNCRTPSNLTLWLLQLA